MSPSIAREERDLEYQTLVAVVRGVIGARREGRTSDAIALDLISEALEAADAANARYEATLAVPA